MPRGRSTALAHPRSAQRPIGCRRDGDCPDFRAATRSVGPKMGLSPLVDTEIGTTPRCALAATLLCSLLLAGCAAVQQWHDNGGEVGPNYRPPRAAVADRWIDAGDRDLRSCSGPPACWWSVFDDPALDRLIAAASQQNLTLRVAGMRILECGPSLALPAANSSRSSKRRSASTTGTSTATPPIRLTFSPSRGTSTTSRLVSTPPGSWTFGAASAAGSRRPTPRWTPRSTATTMPWSCCRPRSPPTTSKCGR